MASDEGNAFSNTDSWPDCFENPKGRLFSSQENSRLPDLIDYEGVGTFCKLWLEGFIETDRVLYDLTSISCYGGGINIAGSGCNRDRDNLHQINYALLCIRNTGTGTLELPLNGLFGDTPSDLQKAR